MPSFLAPTTRRIRVFNTFKRYVPTSAAARRRFLVCVLSVLALTIATAMLIPSSSALTNNGSITTFGSPLTENFDTLASTGTTATWTDNVTIPGWYTQFTTTANPASYTVGTGSSATGAIYSFGSTSSSDRALGSVGSGTTGDIYWAVKLTNNTGSTITSLDISYIGEQWRQGGCTPTPCTPLAQTADFQYQVANAGVITDANTPTTGWLEHDALDFTTPQPGIQTAAALDGNAAANRTSLSSTITVSINPGQEIWLRWKDINHPNNDHGLAIDNLSVMANGAGPTNPTGVGAASPNSVGVGDLTLLTVNVTPGTSPVSSNLQVNADLTPIGGPASQPFFDNGTNGDVTSGDHIFSFSTTVANGTTGGQKTLNTTVSDGEGRSSSAPISLTVLAPTPPTGTGTATPNPVQAGNTSLLAVTVTPGSNPTSSNIMVTGDLTSIGGSASQSFVDDGLNGDSSAGDNIFSFNATVAAATPVGLKNLPINISDAQGRSSSTNISLSVQAAPPPAGAVVISQVYGGGGNAGATLKNDFIEIFNRSSDPFDLTNWSVQYASAAGTTWQKTTLSPFVLQPGQYYLIQEGAGAGGSVDLPTPDATGVIAMSATSAKVALVRDNNALSGACPSGDPELMDLVGYGSPSCFEGPAPAPTLSNTTAALRARNGCKDTDFNAGNFTEVIPNPRNTSSALNPCPAGDEAPEVFSTSPPNGETNVSLTANITIDFDQLVNVSGSWFQISCGTSGIHTATVSGGPTSFILDPDTDFAGSEQCTVTIFAGQVTDQDTDDPPDTMVADYVFSFHTLIPRDPAEHIVMGNPTGATSDINFPDNYLMLKDQYVLAYNCSRGTANWVSWHLDSSWLGSAPRQDDFRADPAVPAGCYQVQGTDYSGSGFDRGHMTPSADRTSTIPDNSATFFMTNMVPQAPNNNQGPWEELESFARVLVSQGNELYIISGPAGTGGVGRNGPATLIAGGHVTVPHWTWKVILVLPNGAGDDVARVDMSTRTIAMLIPNDQNTVDLNGDWEKYLATVDQIEALTGYDFFANVPNGIEDVIEARLDDASDTAPVTDSQSASTDEDTQKALTLSASDYNVNNVLSYTIVDGPTHGTLGSLGTVTCVNGNCTSSVTYQPTANYHGPDSFTFKVNDGDKDSNVATVTLTVNSIEDLPNAADDSTTIAEDSAANSVNVLSNDSDGDGDTLTISQVTQGAHGSVAITSGGTTLTYTPAANFFGSDSFTYTIDDGKGNTAIATVHVTVTNVNDAPVASNDAYSTDSNTTLN
ncbi:MAG TPA: DNA/RNA non-specific endonuclease, partial [Pyrinomonadaceae bacterium]